MNLPLLPVSCQDKFRDLHVTTHSAMPFSLFYHLCFLHYHQSCVCKSWPTICLHKTFNGTPLPSAVILTRVRVKIKGILKSCLISPISSVPCPRQHFSKWNPLAYGKVRAKNSNIYWTLIFYRQCAVVYVIWFILLNILAAFAYLISSNSHKCSMRKILLSLVLKW